MAVTDATFQDDSGETRLSGQLTTSGTATGTATIRTLRLT